MNFIDSLLKLNVAITSRQWIVHALKRPHFKKEMGWGLINFFSTFLKRNNLKLINILPSFPPKLGFTLFSVFLKDILFFFYSLTYIILSQFEIHFSRKKYPKNTKKKPHSITNYWNFIFQNFHKHVPWKILKIQKRKESHK